MQQHNPYEPPLAHPLEQEDAAGVPEAELHYVGFWRRFFALWIDWVVFLPLFGVVYILSQKSRMVEVYWFIPGLLTGLLFHVYLVTRYGGTPGKLLLKTRIMLVNGSSITASAAALRYSVQFVLSALTSLAFLMGTMAMTDEQYFSLGYLARSQLMVEMAPSWYSGVKNIAALWWGIGLIALLFTRKRRALHDFIAGTVVVRSTPLP